MQVKYKGNEKLAFFDQYLALFRKRYKIYDRNYNGRPSTADSFALSCIAGWVGLGWIHIFRFVMGWVGLRHSVDGLGRVIENGLTENSDNSVM